MLARQFQLLRLKCSVMLEITLNEITSKGPYQKSHMRVLLDTIFKIVLRTARIH